MKKFFSPFLLMILGSLSLSAQLYFSDGLKVLNPKQGNWTKTAGRFDSVQVTVAPSGTYTAVDIDLYITAQGSNLALIPDSLEAEYKFSLPAGAVIHEAWLWMNGLPVKAELYERNKAKMIYEALVARRIDPLILYQNPDNTYECRVFPLLNPDPRRLRISYLLPHTVTARGIEVPLDLRMFRSDLAGNAPAIQLRIKDGGNGIPRLSGNQTLVLSNGYWTTTFSGTFSALSAMHAVYFPPIQSSSFCLAQAETPTSGYYQLMLLPNPASQPASHTVYVVDYRSSGIITCNDLMTMLRDKIRFHLRDSDRFNIVFVHNGAVLKLSNAWIDGDSLSVANAFNSLPPNLNSVSSSFLQATNEAVSFLNANGQNGRILILSNAGPTGSTPNFNNQLIGMVLQARAKPYPINVFDFNNQFQYAIWTGSEYFYNNEYFFYNLAMLSNGDFFSLRNAGSSSYYYNSLSSYVDRFSRAFTATKPRHTFDAVNVSAGPVLHSRYRVGEPLMLPAGEAYMETGRYIGSAQNLSLGYYYGLDSSTLYESFTLNMTTASDTFTRKIWGNRWIDDLQSLNTGNQYTMQIIQSSMNYEVLCEYTAMLALEPDTAGTVTNEVPLGVAEASAANAIQLQAFPNPFSSTQRLSVKLTPELYYKEWSLSVSNLSGQVLYHAKGKTGGDESLSIDWYGAGSPELNAGMYLLRFELNGRLYTLRVLKQ
jgi:hypothetical protein